ncbi:hypothetical protein NC651_013051 [Populus alba x Populus x berolinensis]|nr:hypothetical protein NC651_013051 [Populus alba x Populus x berolinensis]
MKLTKSGRPIFALLSGGVMATMIRTFNEFPLFLSMVNTAPNYFLAMVSANNPRTICKEHSGYLQVSQEFSSV